jgi:hypothetical protein
LINPLLQEILIGAQIRQLVGARHGKARQHRNRGKEPAGRDCAKDTPIAGHRSSLFRNAGCPNAGAAL